MIESLNQREFARAFGLTTRQVRNLEQKGLPHRAVKNRKAYPIPEATMWFVDYQKGLVSESAGDLDRAKLRKAEADAEMAEIALQHRKGELLEFAFVEAELEAILSRLRARIVNIVARYRADVMHLDSEAEAEEALTTVRDELLTALRHSIVSMEEAVAMEAA